MALFAAGNVAGAIGDVITCEAGGATRAGGAATCEGGETPTRGAGEAATVALCEGVRAEPVASASWIDSGARGGRTAFSTGFDEPTLRSSTGAALWCHANIFRNSPSGSVRRVFALGRSRGAGAGVDCIRISELAEAPACFGAASSCTAGAGGAFGKFDGADDALALT